MEMIIANLDRADENPVMQGWTANEVRVRLDKYLSSGLQQALGTLKDSKKCLVHSDFSKSASSATLELWSRSIPIASDPVVHSGAISNIKGYRPISNMRPMLTFQLHLSVLELFVRRR